MENTPEYYRWVFENYLLEEKENLVKEIRLTKEKKETNEEFQRRSFHVFYRKNHAIIHKAKKRLIKEFQLDQRKISLILGYGLELDQLYFYTRPFEENLNVLIYPAIKSVYQRVKHPVKEKIFCLSNNFKVIIP